MALGALATPAAAASVRQHFEVIGISYGYGGTVLDGHVYYACDTRADGKGMVRMVTRPVHGLTT
jgi:hypothetical protein